ncbi:ribokinase [Rehaibacterium terrae]|jgi:ribokinase|uniref:Ribokinase n=1 Tax=Rehaibacterium terrae TaxID=1341696 RepID=A0A7W8DDE8_9GAMM|nr:ribokinase [Rehaibacterium terrae]MBB5015077.1 ribokinase [Rehaibacterium terrae]
MSAQVAVVGSYNQDHVWVADRLPAPGETRLGRYHTGPGGKGFNQAVAAARLGAQTLFIGALGEDPAGEHAMDLAREYHLAMRVQRPPGEATGSAAVIVDGQGRNQIVVAPGANAVLSERFVRGQAEQLRAAHVVLTQLEVNTAAVETALALARSAGRITILNPAPVDAGVSAIALSDTDILTPNETEFAAVLAAQRGGPVAGEGVATLGDDELHALCRRLGVPTVVVTLGARGCFVSHADGQLRGDEATHYRIAGEAVEAIDTTGAGDAFNGALAAALALHPGRPFADAVRLANRYAALSTERPGAALAMPTRAEFQARYGG